MKEVFLETIIDTLKIVPFLFFVFLIMEFVEHKLSEKNKKIIEKSGKFGPFFGSILGAFPQCGFSVAATNLFSSGVITTGTLIAIYLSTSDEMLPILISHNVGLSFILKIIFLKVFIAFLFGMILDLIFWKKVKKHEHFHDLCEDHHCGCEKNIFVSSIKHTLQILSFIFIITLLLNGVIYYVGEKAITNLLLKNSAIEPFLTSLVGLIPNCGASVIITELYLSNALSFGAMMSGLLTGSGVALVVLFKENKDKKENLKILCTIYLIGSLVGLLIHLLHIYI